MKANHWALCLSLAAAAFSAGAKADAFYPNITVAAASCGAEQVVWVDLDHGRYYKIGAVDVSKSSNGVYACERVAHANYRPGKSETTTVAKQ